MTWKLFWLAFRVILATVIVSASMLAGAVCVVPVPDSWIQLSVSPSPIVLAGAAVAGRAVYVAGGLYSYNPPVSKGISFVAYFPSNDSWKILPSMPTPRQTLGVVAIQHKIYGIGGDVIGGISNKTEVYDPSSNLWTTMSPMPVATSGFAYSSVNSTIYVMGGVDSNGVTRAVWAFDTMSNSWSVKAPMPGDLPATGGANGAAVSISGKIYVAPSNAHGVATSLVYDIASDRWTDSWNGPAFTNPSGAALSMDFYALTAVENRVFMIGGLDADSQTGATKYNFAYDTVTGVWTRWTDMPTARYGLVAVTVDGIIYAIGGAGSCDPTHTSGSCIANEAYTPAEVANPGPPQSSPIGGIVLWIIGLTVAAAGVTSIGLLYLYKRRHMNIDGENGHQNVHGGSSNR